MSLSDLVKEEKELDETLKRMMKTKTLENFFKDYDAELQDDELWKLPKPRGNGYEETESFCARQVGYYMVEASQAFRRAKYYSEYTKKQYDYYKSMKEQLKNPELIEFVKDYELVKGEQ